MRPLAITAMAFFGTVAAWIADRAPAASCGADGPDVSRGAGAGRGTTPAPTRPRGAAIEAGALRPFACLAAIPGSEMGSWIGEQTLPILGASVVFVALAVLAGLRIRASRAHVAREKESLRLTRSLLRSLDQGVVVANRRGEIQLVNDAAERIVGNLADTVARRGWAPSGGSDVVGTPGDPEAAGSLPIARAVAGERFEDEEYFVRRASEASGRWLLVSGGPLLTRGGEPNGGMVVFRDITAKKAQDDNVRRLTAAVDRSADTIFMTDREGRILYVNQGFERTTGYSSKEAVGRTPRILNSGMHEPGHFQDLWDTVLRGDVYEGTTINRRRDGSLWHGDQCVTPVRDTQDQVTHFVSVTRDMTERRLLLERDAAMRVAGFIQRRLYPSEMPRYAGLDLAGAVVPLDITCGDYLDVIPLPDGAVALVIGDVSGHGIGPALIMVETRAHLRSLLGAGFPLGEAIGRLNHLLCEDLPDDRFASLLILRLEPRARRLTYVNAGHPPGLVLVNGGAVRAQLDPTGPALGLLAEARYGVGESLDLDEGDVVALVTDGITELHSPQGDLFDWPRVVDVVRENRASDAEGIVRALREAATAFAAGHPADDDLTLLICKIGAGTAPSESTSLPAGAGSTAIASPR